MNLLLHHHLGYDVDGDNYMKVPQVLWDAGFRHPDDVSSAMTIETLSECIQQPGHVASRILGVCEKYSSEFWYIYLKACA